MTTRIEPTRLTLGRRLARKTKLQLAKAVAVSSSTVVFWEDGIRDATPHLDKICDALNQSREFFLGDEVPVSNPVDITFRRRQDALRPVKDRAAGVIDLAAGILTPAIREIIPTLPGFDLPDYQGLAPEVAAGLLREEWGLGDAPLRNVVHQLEAKGVHIFFVDESSPSLSAFCKVHDDQAFVILDRSKADGCRSRFDACHELGHLILHRDLDIEAADKRTVEREADAFASAFLLPRDPILEDAPTIFDFEYLCELKMTWKTSVAAMSRRLYDLGHFSDHQYERAFRFLSAKGYRSSPEPRSGKMEQSFIHQEICNRLDSQDVTPSCFAANLGLRKKLVFELMPVLGVHESSLTMDSWEQDEEWRVLQKLLES